MKTSSEQVIDKLYSILRDSSLKSAVGGNLYKSGQRPLNQVAEDIVINFVTGTSSQIQEGVANVNVFVPDMDNGSGFLVKDSKRCRQIEQAATAWAESIFNSDRYSFKLDGMIETLKYEDGKQHFVNIRLKFYYVTF